MKTLLLLAINILNHSNIHKKDIEDEDQDENDFLDNRESEEELNCETTLLLFFCFAFIAFTR